MIETVDVTQRRFDEVDAAFAFDEGEGDARWFLAASASIARLCRIYAERGCTRR